MRFLRPAVALLTLAGFTSTAGAQFGGGGLQNLGVAVGVAAPIGTFDEFVKTGFSVGVRTGMGGGETTWTGRGSFEFSYFPGIITYDNIQFVAIGLDIVHYSRPTFYQFLGLGQYNTKYNLKTTNSLTSTRNGSDFGFTGGVGVNYVRGDLKLFAEFAATTVFTGSENSNWFPVRLGVRF